MNDLTPTEQKALRALAASDSYIKINRRTGHALVRLGLAREFRHLNPSRSGPYDLYTFAISPNGLRFLKAEDHEEALRMNEALALLDGGDNGGDDLELIGMDSAALTKDALGLYEDGEWQAKAERAYKYGGMEVRACVEEVAHEEDARRFQEAQRTGNV